MIVVAEYVESGDSGIRAKRFRVTRNGVQWLSFH